MKEKVVLYAQVYGGCFDEPPEFIQSKYVGRWRAVKSPGSELTGFRPIMIARGEINVRFQEYENAPRRRY